MERIGTLDQRLVAVHCMAYVDHGVDIQWRCMIHCEQHLLDTTYLCSIPHCVYAGDVVHFNVFVIILNFVILQNG